MWPLGQGSVNLEVRHSRQLPPKYMLIPMSVCIYKITIDIENGMSSTRCVECTFIRASGWVLKDIKFIDDDELVIAALDQSKQHW